MSIVPQLPRLSIKDTLKIYTTVPRKFIDDFFSLIQHGKDMKTDYFIELGKLATWLGVQNDSVRKMLYNNYKEGIDYIKKKHHRETGKWGNNHKRVYMTVETMKRICMASRSEKAETVRSYFLEIEEFVFHYNDQIVDGLMRDVQDLVLKKRKTRADGPGLVYIVRVGGTRVAPKNKLGETRQEILTRLSQYNTGRLHDVELLYMYRVPRRKEVETCVKGLLEEKRYKKGREIYEVDWEVISKLIKGCARLSMKLETKNKSKLSGTYYMIFDSDINPER